MRKTAYQKLVSRLAKASKKLEETLGSAPDHYLLVDTKAQTLSLIEDNVVVRKYPVSTSRFGIGNRENSLMTPPGVHRIREKIGSGAPVGRIFRDRIDTGEDWSAGVKADNLILTRILRLEGLEDGVNRGPGIDTFERYIYIHGTNNEASVGTTSSHGCVSMKNGDIVDLFDTVKEGAIVLID